MKTKFIIPVATMAAFLLAGCGSGNSNNTPLQTNAAANSSSPAMLPQTYAQKKVDIAALTQAVQQYKTTEGSYPKSLQDLAPNYLQKIPQAPPGCKFNYDPNSGAVSLVQQ